MNLAKRSHEFRFCGMNKKLLFFLLITVYCSLFTAKAQPVWHELKGAAGHPLHGYIDGGPVRALYHDICGGQPAIGDLWVGGDFYTMKDPATPWWQAPMSSIMKWGYCPPAECPPGGNFQWGYPDNCEPSEGHPEFSVRAISAIVDSTILLEYLVYGGSFNHLYCVFPADPNDMYAWNLGIFPPPSLNSGYYLRIPYITLMDTVYAIATVQGEHCTAHYPRLRTYLAAKCTFCMNDSSNYDTSRYIACYIPSNNCNYVDSIDYMQGGSNGPVYAITAIDTGEMYAGGTFDSAGVIKANNIARWNGLSWDSLGSGVNGTVKAILHYNNQIYAGGAFTTAGGSPANNIARWDGAQWWPVGTGTNGTVYALTIHNSELYAGGAFTQAGGNSANHLARWDGTNWSDVGGGRNDDVYALASYFGELYAGGKFSGGTGDTIKWIARYGDLATGVSANNNKAQNGIQVYPNPTTDNLIIETPEIATIVILNIEGQIIKTITTAEKQTSIDVADLSSGVYIIKAKTERGVAVKKFIKE